MADLFDSPWKILIIAVVIIVLFGSKKLPMAARSLGRSMRILKSEVANLHEDDADETTSGGSPVAAPAQLATPAPVAPVTPVQPTTMPVTDEAAHRARIDSLEQQLREMKESADKKAAVAADQQTR